MGIVVRQLPHDLDGLRVFREHLLAFGALDVVARGELLLARVGAPSTFVAAVRALSLFWSAEGGAGSLVAAVGGFGLNCSSNTSCDAVWTSSFGSSIAIAPADVIIPLTR